jgi:hypothetical protein
MKTSALMLSVFFAAALPAEVFAASAAGTPDERADLTVMYAIPSVLSLKDVTGHEINLKVGGVDHKPFDVVTLEIDNNESNAVIYVSDQNDGHVVSGANKIKYYLSCEGEGGQESVQPLNQSKPLLKDIQKGKQTRKVTIYLDENDTRSVPSGAYKGQVTFQIVAS